MTSKVGPKGQVVIPKAMRDRLDIAAGDVVEFELEDDAVRVAPIRRSQSLKGHFAGRGLIETLESDHRKELRR